jgi:hypothetical protein
MSVLDPSTHNSMRRNPICALALALLAAAGCSNNDATTGPNNGTSFSVNPCSISGTLQLSAARTAVADCSNGGTTVTLAGNGASYLVVAQFAASLVPNAFVPYHVSSGTAISALRTRARTSPFASRSSSSLNSSDPAIKRPRAKQLAFDRMLRGRARQQLKNGKWSQSYSLSRAVSPSASISATTTPAVGSVRNFQVLSNSTGSATSTVSAKLVYAGTDVLIYVDTLSPPNGFTSDQLNAFGQLFDQTLYPIDVTNFGPPSDIDQNGHIIMLMTPVVNALTTASDCTTQGYVAGFFDEDDLGGLGNPSSNNGEIFYSIVPDPNGAKSCAHSVDDVSFSVPATFLHELQHLISFSQHVVVHGGDPEYGWLDEGLSIVAEELGSVYYEQKCPGTACRTDPSQLFPDSSQGFVSDFLYDSYQYALLPDTASVTLHSDADDGFSWRGGDWLLMRWLGDQMGSSVFKHLDENTLTGVANIENVSGRQFPSLFADFGLSLFTDSLVGLPRATASSADRFVSRNMRQLWNRLFITSGTSDVPLAFPVQLFPISADTSTAVMDPGTGSYFRLDTPTNAATVTIQFAGPGGTALPAGVHPQLSIFRLPPGQ